jgi:alkylation response protein AidB-like acyl-CoA dehydrogenase
VPENLPADINILVEQANQFAINTLIPLGQGVEQGTQQADEARREAIAAAKSAGIFRLTQPPEYGGSAAGPLALVAVREALASHNPRWLSDLFGPGPGILANAEEPVRRQYLLPVLDGEKLAGFGFTEPRDAPSYSRATRAGDDLIVTGQKSYVTRGTEVDFINVLADIEDEGRAFVVVDSDAPGVTRERIFSTIDGSQHAAFRFESVRVPKQHMMGVPGEGMRKAMQQIGNTRLTMAAEASGLLRFVVGFVDQHMRKGEARNGPSDIMRLRYGELRIKAYAARATVFRAAHLAHTGANVVNESIAAKAFATETLGEVVDAAMQLVGGGALLDDHPLAVLYNQARSLRVAEGLTDVLRANIARGALELNKGTL